MLIKSCITPTLPPIECYNTKWFGIPRGTCGRNTHPICGIMLHCLDMSMDAYQNGICTTMRKPLLQDHWSLHYVISADGLIRRLVEEDNIAWGLQSYVGSFPPVMPLPLPGWNVLPAMYPGVAPDTYLLHIGIVIPKQIESDINCIDPCKERPLNMSWTGYQRLVRLVAYLTSKYNIPVDVEHVAFHEQVTPTGSEDTCNCLDGLCFVCDVDSYCEGCSNPGDSSYLADDSLAVVYGETATGCRARIPLVLNAATKLVVNVERISPTEIKITYSDGTTSLI